MIVVIIDCGSGNLRSVTKALEHAAAEAGVSASVQVTRSPDEVLHADRIVLPGQGAFASCLAGLQSVDGLREALDEAVHVRGKPYFGILRWHATDGGCGVRSMASTQALAGFQAAWCR